LDSKQFHRRVWIIVLTLVLIVFSMGASLYDIQINQGEAYYEQSQRKIAETESVEAGRGQVLDRNGRVLVSDRAVYQVTLNTSLMGTAQERNDTLIALTQAARDSGLEWADSLPITMEAPFVFTTTNPYYTTTLNEDGTLSRSLTKLGRLAVKMDWIRDPTVEEPPNETPAAPAPVPSETPEQPAAPEEPEVVTGDLADRPV